MALLERVAEPGEHLREREAEQQAIKRKDELEDANGSPSFLLLTSISMVQQLFPQCPPT